MGADREQTLDPELTLMAAAERQSLAARLLARLAHEIRNPLSSMDVHVQLLEEDFQRLPPQVQVKAAGRLEIIRAELHRLETIVRNYLSLAGPLACDPEELSAREVVRHVVHLLRPEAQTREIALTERLAEALPRVRADRTQLTQAVMNLTINALQAAGPGGRVEWSGEVEDGGMWLRVTDSGPGVPADRQTLIFEPFYTTKAEGTGLGLWIVQQIMAAHGGAVRVANAPAGGAVFSLWLPLRRSQ